MLNAENLKAEIPKTAFPIVECYQQNVETKLLKKRFFILVYARKAQCCGQNELGSVYMSSSTLNEVNELNVP